MHRKAVAFGHALHDLRHVGEVQLRVHALAVEVHRHGDDVHVAGALAVAEQRALDAVGAGHGGQFRRRHGAAAVVVGMQAHRDVFPGRQVVAEIFHLVGEHIGRRRFHGGGQVQDDLLAVLRFPDPADRLADRHGEIRARSGNSSPASTGRSTPCRDTSFRVVPDPGGAVHGDPEDLLLRHLEGLLPLYPAGGVVDMDDGALHADQRFEGPLDEVFPGLGEDLDGDVIGDAVLFHQLAGEVELHLGRGGKADLDLLESAAQQHLPETHLLGNVHRVDQCLVAVPEVHAAPDRRPGQALVRPAAVADFSGPNRSLGYFR